MSFVPNRVAGNFIRLVSQFVREEGNRSAAARRLGISPSYVAKLERGEGAGNIRQTTVEEVLARLGIPVESLDSLTFFPEQWRELVVAAPEKRGEQEHRFFASFSQIAETLEGRFDRGDTPSAAELRDLARRFLGMFEISLAQEVRDAPTDERAVELGHWLVQALTRFRDR